MPCCRCVGHDRICLQRVRQCGYGRHTEAGIAYTTNYTYDAGNRVTSITYPNQRVVTYARDGAEGTTTDDGTCTYSPLDSNLIGEAVCPSGTGTYVYNAFNQRTRKTTSNGTTVYHYDLRGRLIAETTLTGNLVRDYVYADDQPIAKIESGETVLYVHTDHLDTPRIGTDLNRNVVWRFEGNAFGDTPPTGSATLNLRYPGQYFDFETGLYYNINRYYDPRIGRYISSDPVGLAGGLNTYLYGYANPLRWSDPTGLAATGSSSSSSGSSSGSQCPDGGPDCDKVKEKCIEECSESSLPSGDHGFRFWNCVNKCMRDGGCGPDGKPLPPPVVPVPTPAPKAPPTPKPTPRLPLPRLPGLPPILDPCIFMPELCHSDGRA